MKIKGFDNIKEGTFYTPLLLRCRAVQNDPSGPLCPVVGYRNARYKRLRTHKIYNLWVMYGRDDTSECHLYFKERHDRSAFKMIHGRLEFIFEAEPFAEIAMNAGSYVLQYFLENAVFQEKSELLRFLKEIQGNVSERKKGIILNYL